jgi:hypothetical protein
MSTLINIGAPSLTGVDANDLVNEFFTGAEFPREMRLRNFLARNIALPEVHAFLTPIDGKADVKIKSFDELHRLVSSIEQISELNKHLLAMSIEDLTPATPIKVQNAPKVAPKNAVVDTAVVDAVKEGV